MTKLSKKIHPTEEDLRKTERWLESKLAKYEESLRYSILMAGNELLENAVKYHMGKGLSSSIHFQLSLSKEVRIDVTNVFQEEKDLQVLLSQIDEINQGLDPQIQYMYRLKEIMENRVPGESRLGLLRIAGEGNFGLQYEVKDKKLIVSARKYYYSKRKDPMESLIRDDYAIEIKEEEPVEIHWTGRSRDLEPAAVLDEYLSSLVPHLLDREVVVSFTDMDSLNSSSIPPILTFMKELEQKRVRTKVLYGKDIYWQKASFKPLSVLTRDFQFVSIKAV